MNVEQRIKRLEARVLDAPLFVFRSGYTLTADQAVEVAEAEAEGREVMIFAWAGAKTQTGPA